MNREHESIPSRSGLRRIAAHLFVLAVLVGCSGGDPVLSPGGGPVSSGPAGGKRLGQAGDQSTAQGFYPLAIGDHWWYTRTFRVQVIIDGQPPSPPNVVETVHEREQICHEARDGREYLVEEERWHDASGDGGSSWVRYRQDDAGLYEADVCLCDPPVCIDEPQVVERLRAARPADPDERVWAAISSRLSTERERAAFRTAWERTRERLRVVRTLARQAPPTQAPAASDQPELIRLRYPLYPGQSWLIRDEPGFTFAAEVEALDLLHLPAGRAPAYRVRITPPFGGEIDVLTWWSTCGFLKFSMHDEGVVIDESGNPIGRFIVDENMGLVGIDLVERRGCFVEREREHDLGATD